MNRPIVPIPEQLLRQEAFLVRFWRYVERVPDPAACWLWVGPRTSSGYGQLRGTLGRGPQGRRFILLAHRVSYSLAKGTIPAGLIVRHSCDNPRCVNPEHLVRGTMADNARDMIRRGRKVVSEVVRRKGPSHPAARHTQEARDGALHLLVVELMPYELVRDITGVPLGTLARWVKQKYGDRYRRKSRPMFTAAVRDEIARTGRWSGWQEGWYMVDGKPTYTGGRG